MELYDTELRIHEVGLSQSPDVFCGQDNLRLECLYACFNAAKGAWKTSVPRAILVVVWYESTPRTETTATHAKPESDESSVAQYPS